MLLSLMYSLPIVVEAFEQKALHSAETVEKALAMNFEIFLGAILPFII